MSSIVGYWTPNIAVFYVIRIVQQIAGSAVLSTAGGTVADIFPGEKIAGNLGYIYLGMSAGPTVGPLIGGLITQASSWRWTFVFSGCFAAVIWVGMYFIVPETLRQKPIPEGQKQKNIFVKVGYSLLYNRFPFVFWPVLAFSMCFAVMLLFDDSHYSSRLRVQNLSLSQNSFLIYPFL